MILHLDVGHRISLANNFTADLSDINQRMAFVLNATARFDVLLRDSGRYRIEQAIRIKDDPPFAGPIAGCEFFFMKIKSVFPGNP